MLKLRSLIVFGLVAFAGQTAWGQAGWTQWPVSEGGNDHWYRLTGPGTWPECEAEAVNAGGHLATINDSAENDWVFDNLAIDNVWLGFYQDSTDASYSEPSEGWKWVGDPALCRWSTGNPNVCYTNWRATEPNDNGGELYLEFKGQISSFPNKWNDNGLLEDNMRGVIEIDFIPNDIPVVGTWGLFVMVLALVIGGTMVLRERMVAA